MSSWLLRSTFMSYYQLHMDRSSAKQSWGLSVGLSGRCRLTSPHPILSSHAYSGSPVWISAVFFIFFICWEKGANRIWVCSCSLTNISNVRSHSFVVNRVSDSRMSGQHRTRIRRSSKHKSNTDSPIQSVEELTFNTPQSSHSHVSIYNMWEIPQMWLVFHDLKQNYYYHYSVCVMSEGLLRLF